VVRKREVDVNRIKQILYKKKEITFARFLAGAFVGFLTGIAATLLLTIN